MTHRAATMNRLSPLLLACFVLASAQAADLAAVISKPVSRNIELPGEMLPLLSVSPHAKMPSYVERVTVDRGSLVKQGELLRDLTAPARTTRIAEPEPKADDPLSDRGRADV